MSISYKQFLQELCLKARLNIDDTSTFMNKFIEMLHRELRVNGELNIPSVGKFVRYTSKARVGRNPATGQPMNLPPKTTVKFRVSKNLKNVVQPYEEE